jgi:nucleoid-associated protein YgaU
MGRYNNTPKIMNDIEYYDFLTKKRGIKKATHYGTPVLHNPSVSERLMLRTSPHIWKYGDRLSNLAFKYYGDVTYWWVIAWYNGVPTEAHLDPGDPLDIPINIEQALKALGV